MLVQRSQNLQNCDAQAVDDIEDAGLHTLQGVA